MSDKPMIKVMWLAANNVRHIDYFNSETEAKRAILNSRDRGWGSALILWWVESIQKYCSIPGSELMPADEGILAAKRDARLRK